ncbi:hypothetical protein RF11_10378 [Thelohanellus kitauei]|uniref:Uncharacterized protein n=1 Tax=Thelohanellus kitauei TaxID=669202 RepID=A0A0C2MZA3_THEKT|nr:hypothetical protein RF11_10378 [Thelohanellus kitauei]
MCGPDQICSNSYYYSQLIAGISLAVFALMIIMIFACQSYNFSTMPRFRPDNIRVHREIQYVNNSTPPAYSEEPPKYDQTYNCQSLSVDPLNDIIGNTQNVESPPYTPRL